MYINDMRTSVRVHAYNNIYHNNYYNYNLFLLINFTTWT